MNEQTLALLATAGAAVIYGVVEAVKRTERVNLCYLPLVGLGVGIVVGLLLSLSVGENLIAGAMLGAVSGLGATGIHEAQKNTRALMGESKESDSTEE